MEKSHVSPQALGVGYVVFFLYSAGIGLLAIVLVLIVAAKQPADASATVKAEA
jgi:PAT family beta-lactamase induction signal transducer AmpG